MNVYSEEDEQTRACPTCGQAIPAQSSVCGYCGHDFSGRFTGVPPPMAGRNTGSSPLRTLLIAIPALGLVATAAFIFFVGSKVDNAVDQAFDSVPEVDIPNAGGTGGGAGEETITGKGSYKNARALVADLNDNGVKCSQFDLVTENSALQAATCTSGANPLTIQVMYDQLSYDAIVDGYKQQKSLDVAYGTNWTVITPTPELAKAVARALDGKTN